MSPMTLPWTGPGVPHAVLDINRGCDIRCRACYNARPVSLKSLSAIDAELDTLSRLRRLHAVTIAGGEPLLHPDLFEVIRRIKGRGFVPAMLTNGYAFDARRAAELAAAGLALVLFHIDRGQRRADLTDPDDPAAIRALRAGKITVASDHGITAGMISTLFDDQFEDAVGAIYLLLEMPAARYLLFTGHLDFPARGDVTGTLRGGFRSPAREASPRQVTADRFRALMAERFGATPFATVPSSGPVRYDAWLSYQGAVVYEETRRMARRFMTSSLVERVAIRLLRAAHGRYPFFHAPRPCALWAQLCLNAVAGGNPGANLAVLAQLARGRRLISKHLVFQQGPTPDATGRLSVCRDCPDAVVSGGRLVPVCLADRVSDETASPASPPAFRGRSDRGQSVEVPYRLRP